MRRRSDAWILGLLVVLLLAGSYFAAGPRSGKENKDSTTWNPDPNGVKAFYTLLGERLGYKVAQLRRPYDQIPPAARLLIVVQPASAPRPVTRSNILPWSNRPEHISAEEADALMKWVRGGGVVMFFADRLRGIPTKFRSTGRVGRGAVYAFSSRRPITNRGMRDYRNAVAILRIVDRHVTKDGLIIFDEYHHGFAESRPLASYVSRQVWTALGMIFVAGLVLCHTYGKRFGAVRSLPTRSTARPGVEFVQALARLYQRAGATDLAADILCGVRPDGTTHQAEVRTKCRRGSESSGQVLTPPELVAIANRVHELEAKGEIVSRS
ncbi:MAG: DUF4350 domain-containing protein [Armatimonadota bacterium]